MDPELTQAEVSRVARWARTLGADQRLELACGAPGPTRAGGSQTSLQWPGCLKALDAADLAELTAAAPLLRARPCPRDHPAVDALVSLLAGLGLGHRLEVRPGKGAAAGEPRHTALPVSRRSLLAWVRPAGHRAAEQGATGQSATGLGGGGLRRAPEVNTDHGEAQHQVRLSAALRELRRQEGLVEQSGRGAEPASDEEQSPYATSATRAHRLTSSGCTACTTCVRACPTDALALTSSSDGQSVTLELETAACIGCRQCLALCPAQALTDHDVLTWPEVLRGPARKALETVEVRPCTRCRTPFAGDGDLCQVCALRAQNPFGSWLPPGYVTPRVFAPPVTGDDD